MALVLGTAPTFEGRPNLFFRYRIDAAVQPVGDGRRDGFLVSGDNGRAEYDEPTAMRDALIAAGVPPEVVTCDFAGFRTLDSVVRAREVFGLGVRCRCFAADARPTGRVLGSGARPRCDRLRCARTGCSPRAREESPARGSGPHAGRVGRGSRDRAEVPRSARSRGDALRLMTHEDLDDTTAAYHEAGHVLVAHLLGGGWWRARSSRSATGIADTRRSRWRGAADDDSLRRSALVALAGPVAETLWLGEEPDAADFGAWAADWSEVEAGARGVVRCVRARRAHRQRWIEDVVATAARSECVGAPVSRGRHAGGRTGTLDGDLVGEVLDPTSLL